MKKFSILALALVLCAAMFTGCRNRNDVNNTSTPTSGMTTAPTAVTTRPTTQPTTEATTETTMPATENIPDTNGNGPMDDTVGTDATGDMEGRTRGMIPGNR